ncbi:MAG: DUF1573 domain-containing protein [Aureliella sp.]
MRFDFRFRDVLARTIIALACMCVLTGSRVSQAQDWARKMFETTSHDFGVVPRGAKSEFEFRLKNSYKENVHIASARSSCACTQPRISKADLKTYEEGAIIAELNTQSFVGQRSAVVTVVIDRPYYAEVQLLVKGNIRSDIVIEPGEVRFGNVDVGSGQSAEVQVSYQGSGNRDWQITDVRSTNQNLSVKLDPLRDASGRTSYNMTVKLKESAPAGELNDEIQIVTNERQYNQVTLPVRATVVPQLSIAPQSIELGSLKPGAKANYRLVVKAKVPFEISKIDCSDERFRFEIPEGKKPVQIIPVSFEAGDEAGAFKRTITVTSTLPDGASADVVITGNIAL